MKYLVIRDGENVKHIAPIDIDFDIKDAAVADKMPVFRPQIGKVAKLKYTEAEGLHYEYTEAPVSSNVSGSELMNMIKEVL